MATYVAIRGLLRKPVRIGKLGVTNQSSVTVDLDDPIVRRDLNRHATLGRVIIVRNVAASATGPWITQGGEVVSSNSQVYDPTNRTLLIKPLQVNTAGAVTATNTNSQTVTVAAASGTPRVDLIQVSTTTGVASIKAGTPAAIAPATPAVDAGNIALATIDVPANSQKLGTLVDVRPLPDQPPTVGSIDNA